MYSFCKFHLYKVEALACSLINIIMRKSEIFIISLGFSQKLIDESVFNSD